MWISIKISNVVEYGLRNPDDTVVANKSMFVLIILENIKQVRLKISQGSVTVL